MVQDLQHLFRSFEAQMRSTTADLQSGLERAAGAVMRDQDCSREARVAIHFVMCGRTFQLEQRVFRLDTHLLSLSLAYYVQFSAFSWLTAWTYTIVL